MAKRKQTKPVKQDELIDIVEVSGQEASNSEKTTTYLLLGLVAIVLLIGAWWAYNEFVKKPKQQEAIEQMWQAQNQFAQDSFQLALSNPGGGYPGFVEIADSYSGTPAGNIANYYAGVSYLHLGQYDAAVSYLEDFSPAGDLLPSMKNSALGDAYAEKGDLNKALGLYQKAANSDVNEATTPFYLQKLAYLQKKLGKNEAAMETFRKIAQEFPNSTYSREADKMLTLLSK